MDAFRLVNESENRILKTRINGGLHVGVLQSFGYIFREQRGKRMMKNRLLLGLGEKVDPIKLRLFLAVFAVK